MFSWLCCNWAPLDLISQILQPILYSHCLMDMQVYNTTCPNFWTWGGRAMKQPVLGYEMKTGQWFNIFLQSTGWATLTGSKGNSKWQDRFLGMIKDHKSTGSSLQRLPVWKRNTWVARKNIQQHNQNLATSLCHTFILANFQLAEQLYRVWNKRAQSSLHWWLKKKNAKMTQKYCLLHLVQCWA